MNTALRKSINVRKMLWRKFTKNRTQYSWQCYRKQRNKVVSLGRKSKQKFLLDKCKFIKTGREFWQTVKPLISDKVKEANTNIILKEDDDIINNQTDVCNMLNHYFINATVDIGNNDVISDSDTLEDIIETYEEPESVQYINQQVESQSRFSFKIINEDIVLEKIKNLNIKKSTGWDNIPPKLIKLGATVLCKPVCQLVNKSITVSQFPNILKRGEIVPIYKKGNVLDKTNYRPVSVLPTMTKVFEGILIDQ